MEAERKGAEAHLKSCEAEQLLSQATDLTQSAATARAKEAEVRLDTQLFELAVAELKLPTHICGHQICIVCTRFLLGSLQPVPM